MNIYNYTKLFTSGNNKKPHTMHKIAETVPALYAIDSSNTKVLLKSTDDGKSWSTVETRTYPIQAIWHDVPNERILIVDCDVELDGGQYDNHQYMWELDYGNSDTITELGNITVLNQLYDHRATRDIFMIGSDIFTTTILDGIPTVAHVYIYKWSNPTTWTEVADFNTTGINFEFEMFFATIVGASAYFTADDFIYVDTGISLMEFDSQSGVNTLSRIYTHQDYEKPSAQTSAIFYDDENGKLLFIGQQNGGSQYDLFQWDITGASMTIVADFPIVFMLPRNVGAGLEGKGYHLTLENIYEWSESKNNMVLFSKVDVDAQPIAITDNFIITSSATPEMWKYDDLTSDVAFFRINHPIMDAPTARLKIKNSATTIIRGQTLYVEDNYTSQSDTNIVRIFAGKVIDFDDKVMQSVWLESPAMKELDRIFPEGTYSGSSQSIINTLITTYCKYITVGTLAAGQAMGSITYGGDKSLRNIILTLTYINNFIWALTPMGALNFNAGVIDSGVDLTETNKVWKVRTGNQGEGMNYWKIRGAIVGGSQLEKVLQNESDQLLNGLSPLSETYAELNTQSLVNLMASARKTRTEKTSKIVNYKHYDPTLGFIQPGETKTFEYGLSEPVVPQDQFIIYELKYRAREGIGDYKIVDEPV